MNEESGMETYITICKISSQWNWPYDAGSSNPVLCDSLDAVGVGGGGSRSREHVYTNG